jgi:hypothetical protein
MERNFTLFYRNFTSTPARSLKLSSGTGIFLETNSTNERDFQLSKQLFEQRKKLLIFYSLA